MIDLQDREFEKLSELSGVSLHDIQKLYAMNIINIACAFDYIIRKDYEKIRRTHNYKPSQIVMRLARLYCVSEEKVRSAIYRKSKRLYYCDKCRKKIPKSMYSRNSGLCDSCVADSIEV